MICMEQFDKQTKNCLQNRDCHLLNDPIWLNEFWCLFSHYAVDLLPNQIITTNDIAILTQLLTTIEQFSYSINYKINERHFLQYDIWSKRFDKHHSL